MREGPRILVLCTANVCRSVYAAALLREGLSRAGITVDSAGFAGSDSRPACALVRERAGQADLDLPLDNSRQVRQEDIERADLVLVMTAFQRTAIARQVPSARRRTMTLIEAAVVSSALRAEGVRCASLAEYVEQLDRHRSEVPLPVVHDVRRVLGVFPVKSRHVHPAITIEDGHVSPVRGEHEQTLDLVRRQVEQLLAAWAGQPWLVDAPTAGERE